VAAHASLCRVPRRVGVKLRQAVNSAAVLLFVRLEKGTMAGLVMNVFFKKAWNEHGSVKEKPHERLPQIRSSRSRRISRAVRSTISSVSGSSDRNTHTPSFFLSLPLARAGVSVIFSPEVSSSRVSPGCSCNSSRTGFGRTIRPALSSVNRLTIMAFYNGKWYL